MYIHSVFVIVFSTLFHRYIFTGMKKIKCVKLESVVCNLRSIIFVFVMVLVFKSSSLWLSGGWYVYQQRNEVHNNCGIEIYYQTDMQNTNENMLLELLCQIISEPCFNTLRTKEQLGNTNTQEKCSAVCGNTICCLSMWWLDKYFCSEFYSHCS